ncbi:DUF5686 and carboxypeptidase-like regulatory domain-containing protein [Salegentibacter sediminis]|uniref:DUF5686 and carboxypeptidase-like regulatory domain-containing protein n=1 Tax=Salegentibacter sediminis TaxID=1930251 RepID=UPI0009C0528F|nr:DUF5686 and carboxypeptidase-like regulatory domain-containing protein [Salegentibacter sediminis]
MRHCLLLALVCIVSFTNAFAQHKISGRVVNAETGEPLPYAKISIQEKPANLTNIDGSFSLNLKEPTAEVTFSYVGFSSRTIQLSAATEFIFIRLKPYAEILDAVVIDSDKNPANAIIRKAIARRDQNDPEKAVNSFSFKSYNKFLIDNENNRISLETDSTMLEVETIIETGAAFFSEKISEYRFEKGKDLKEMVLAMKNAGFKKPVYEILSLSVNPFSLYKKDYSIFETDYAGPLSEQAFRNYKFKILDTANTAKPAFVVYFEPKRQQAVAGLEGILYLDTSSFAIQKFKAQLLGAIKLETDQEYEYFEEENLWFPKKQVTRIRPGSGGKRISVFGGVISTGRLQSGGDIISTVLSGNKMESGLYLTSTTTNYEIQFNSEEKIENPSAQIEVAPEAFNPGEDFWQRHRQEDFTFADKNLEERVIDLVKEKNVERQIEIKNTISTGYYPVGFWDFDLGKFFKYNNYEGLRLGFGGKTNNRFSDKFNINGYAVYGIKDEVLKYGLGTKIALHKPSGTNLKFKYTSDIIEVGSFNYLQGVNEFSIIEPRFVNISFFYTDKTFSGGLTHRFTSRLNSELQISQSQISNIRDYAYIHEGQQFSDYKLSQATISFLWRPFARFLKTSTSNILIEKGYPKFTGQFSQAFAGFMKGNFSFSKVGLKIEHEIKRLDRSRTEFILEGNFALGDLPLTHAFHALPNNGNQPEILKRFSVAGHTSFETMYYNEFFSDRQAMLHVKHQFRPIELNRFMKPEVVLISRHAIGAFKHPENHANISFNTLDHVYSEAGLEVNNILAGFGLGTAYRYGGYNLPGFKQNFAFKFTFQLKI